MLSRPAWLSLVFLLAAVAGCGSTDTSGAGGGASGTMSIKIVSPASDACADVPADRTVYVPVSIETSGLTLKPPGTCGATTQCGSIQLSVNDAVNNSGTAAVIDLISDPALGVLSGTLAIKATAVGDDGVALVGTTGKPVTAEVTIVAKESCNGNTGGTGGSTTTSTGGAGGSTTTSTGGTGGSTSIGGTGGAGGSTTTSTGGAGGSTTTSTTTTTSTGAGGSTMTGGTGGV